MGPVDFGHELFRGHQPQSSENWTPFNLRVFLQSCEGRTWRAEDTQQVMERAEQIDSLLVQLIEAVGLAAQSDNRG